MATVNTLMRFEALKFFWSRQTGMPIITATFWVVSTASAGRFAHQVSALAMFDTRSGLSLSRLAKVRSARPVGTLSVSQVLESRGIVKRHAGPNEGGGEGALEPSRARWIEVAWGDELYARNLGFISTAFSELERRKGQLHLISALVMAVVTLWFFVGSLHRPIPVRCYLEF